MLNTRWSKTHNCWYIAEDATTLHKIIGAFRNYAWVDASALYGGSLPPEVSFDTNEISELVKKPTRHYALKKPIPDEYLQKLKRKYH